jgi:hypothetical protein
MRRVTSRKRCLWASLPVGEAVFSVYAPGCRGVRLLPGHGRNATWQAVLGAEDYAAALTLGALPHGPLRLGMRHTPGHAAMLAVGRAEAPFLCVEEE